MLRFICLCMAISFYLLDTETTGLKTGFHEINQISLIRVADGMQRTVNVAVVYPDRATPEALRIQKKSKYDLKKGVTKEAAVSMVDRFLEEDKQTPAHRCIVAHNASFDRRFCHALWDSVMKPFTADLWLCTMAFSKRYAKKVGFEKIAEAQGLDKPKFGLAELMGGFGLPSKFGAHSAAIDTQNTLTLFNFLMEQKLDYVSLIKRHPHKKTQEVYYDVD
jgi:DNA polymerase III epsilon subunit-like protein